MTRPDQHGHKYIKIPEALAKVINQVAIRCPQCEQTFYTHIDGIQFAEAIVGRCQNKDYELSNLPVNYKISYFWTMNLSCVYLSLCNDTGFRGIQASAWSNQCNVPCKQSYERQCKFIFQIMDTFYNKNIHKAIVDVQDFYVRNDLGVRDENGIVNICISLDGAYGRRGRESTYCISVAIDVWTGRVVDFHFCVKCFSCKTSNDYNTNGTCPYGLFHGASGSMERYNAVVLFCRSEAKGLRYTSYVADGDSKILPELHEKDPYPGILIEKVECANHLGKRCHKALVKFGEKWTLAKGAESAANRGRGRGRGNGRGRGRGEGEEGE